LAYAKDPEIELTATTAIDIAVVISGGNCGKNKIRIGTNIKPPPAPISVPNVPMIRPIPISIRLLSKTDG
jgi:hypothetical protein